MLPSISPESKHSRPRLIAGSRANSSQKADIPQAAEMRKAAQGCTQTDLLHDWNESLCGYSSSSLSSSLPSASSYSQLVQNVANQHTIGSEPQEVQQVCFATQLGNCFIDLSNVLFFFSWSSVEQWHVLKVAKLVNRRN